MFPNGSSPYLNCNRCELRGYLRYDEITQEHKICSKEKKSVIEIKINGLQVINMEITDISYRKYNKAFVYK